MSSFRIRPRFTASLPMKVEEVAKLFQAKLDEECACCEGRVYLDTVVLQIPEVERHYWSPCLTITLEEDENDSTFIRGLYGPAPNVWAIFTYGYAAIAILAMFAGSYGLSQLALDKSPWMLWTVPGFLFLGLVLYLIAQTGQKVGAEQTFTLHHFYEDTIGERTHIQ